MAPQVDAEALLGATLRLFDWHVPLPADARFRDVVASRGMVWTLDRLYKDGTVGRVAALPEIDESSVAVRAGSQDPRWDLNNDLRVNEQDRVFWVEHLRHTYFGDANLDGEFGTSDLVQILSFGQCEDVKVGNSVWGTGDWNGDTEFTSADFVVALAPGGFEAGPRAARSVPEPTAPVLMLIAAFAGAFSAARRDRNRSTHARWLTETRNFKTGASGFDGSG